MENETILPRSDNLADKGRSPPKVVDCPPERRHQPVRRGRWLPAASRWERRPGRRVFGTRASGPKPGILTGNGAVFIGTKGIMATCSRGEGVWLLPSAR